LKPSLLWEPGSEGLPIFLPPTFARLRKWFAALYRLSGFNVILLTAFSSLALPLATTGIYGVLSYAVNRRTAEIGLRVALAASPTNILGKALDQGMRPAVVGMLLGALGAWWLSRYLEALLFGIKPFDSVTYVMVAALLLATALIACLLPGRRAMRIDPAIALRTD
jgi:putative ABC transport system permease protein